MKSFEEIQQFFSNDLREWILPLEEFRVQKVGMIKRRIHIGILMTLPMLGGIIFRIPVLVALSIFALMLSLGLAYEVLGKMQISLQQKFKFNVLPKFLAFLFDEFDYIPNQRIAHSLLIKSQLISDDITKVEGEDFMRFKLGDTGIMFCETTVYRRNKSDGPIFKGVFLVASFNKSFTSQTVILPNRSVSLISKIFETERVTSFQKIKLEDTDFKKAFAVYSTDQVEARYILSTSLMQRILAYSTKVKGKISFSFVDDMMFCAIPNYDNLFEPAIFNSFLDFGFIHKSYNAIKLYTDIVDDLNLNVRIWTKQPKVKVGHDQKPYSEVH